MNKKNTNLLLASIGIVIFGFLIDDDAKEPSTTMRFVEFFAMVGIVFTISFMANKAFIFIKNRVKS